MDDIDLLILFLRNAGIPKKDIGLVAEMLHTVDMLVNIDEEELRNLMWPSGKKGEQKPLLTVEKITSLFSLREQILFSVQSQEARAMELREYLTVRREKEQLSEFLRVFLPTEVAATIATSVGSLDSWIDLYSRGGLGKKLNEYRPLVSAEVTSELVDVMGYTIRTTTPKDAMRQLAQDCEGYGLLVAVSLYANHITSKYRDFDIRKFTLKNGSIVSANDWGRSEYSIKASLASAFVGRSVPEGAYDIAKRAYYVFSGALLPEERRVVFVFADAVRKVLTESVPKFLEEAIHTTHPFLLRPLFRSYPSAVTYAIGGKISSSLETIWGDVGEELFIAMGSSLRSVRNGGIDVVDGRDAYDIKSGPAVMNTDQIAILEIKQRIISQEKRVPGLDTFRVALVYGKSSEIFGTMAPSYARGDILDARTAWEKLTGDPLAAERVYALAGLVADIVGVPGAIEAVSTSVPEDNAVLNEKPSAYDDDFSQIFANAFDPPTSRPDFSVSRLEKIKELDQTIRDLLKVS